MRLALQPFIVATRRALALPSLLCTAGTALRKQHIYLMQPSLAPRPHIRQVPLQV